MSNKRSRKRIGKGRDSHGGTRYVQLPEWVLRTEAYRCLCPGAKALYIELKRRFNGNNNGDVRLSHCEAATLLGLHRNSIGKLFADLQDKGFIWPMEGAYLGPSGVGKTARWRLDEYQCHQTGKGPEKRFIAWRKAQNPRTKSVPPRHNRSDTLTANRVQKAKGCTDTVTDFAKNALKPAQQTGHI